MRKLYEPAMVTSYESTFPIRFVTPISLDLRDSYSQLNEIAALNDNWDGYGAVVPPVEVNWNVISFLSNVEFEISKAPFLFPNPHGTISVILEDASNQKRIEVEVGTTESKYYLEEGGRVTHGTLPQDPTGLPTDIKNFL